MSHSLDNRLMFRLLLNFDTKCFNVEANRMVHEVEK